MSTMRERSRTDWSGDSSSEHIKLGCLQRIADATESMAKGHIALANDRDTYKRWWIEEREKLKKRDRTIIALRGALTKAKKRAKS